MEMYSRTRRLGVDKVGTVFTFSTVADIRHAMATLHRVDTCDQADTPVKPCGSGGVCDEATPGFRPASYFLTPNSMQFHRSRIIGGWDSPATVWRGGEWSLFVMSGANPFHGMSEALGGDPTPDLRLYSVVAVRCVLAADPYNGPEAVRLKFRTETLRFAKGNQLCWVNTQQSHRTSSAAKNEARLIASLLAQGKVRITDSLPMWPEDEEHNPPAE
jgi:hypothetical protein